MPRTKAKSMSAIQLLKEDHEYVKKAFRAFEKMDHEDHDAMKALVSQVCEALKVHTRVEEELFYPAARKAIQDEDLMNEAEVEHDSAKALIRRLERMKPDDPKYVATFTVLGEYVKHHVKEEESEMFPKARRRRINLQRLGDRLMARKIQLAA
ncbi:MAG TPA: hemerythrin domain-containing protein [Burkholderiales bacterium]|nr:hemerythrin domain-containing protein [Burkholderiales bacterium]